MITTLWQIWYLNTKLQSWWSGWSMCQCLSCWIKEACIDPSQGQPVKKRTQTELTSIVSCKEQEGKKADIVFPISANKDFSWYQATFIHIFHRLLQKEYIIMIYWHIALTSFISLVQRVWNCYISWRKITNNGSYLLEFQYRHLASCNIEDALFWPINFMMSNHPVIDIGKRWQFQLFLAM